MPFSADEQELYDWLKSSLPSWFFQDDTIDEELWGAIVKGMQPVRDQTDSWLAATRILEAENAWLNQHARDRGTFRQSTETDPTLRARLRSVEDAVTRPAIIDAITAVLVATGQSLITVAADYDFDVADENNPPATVTVTAGSYTFATLIAEIQPQLPPDWTFEIEDGVATLNYPDSVFSVTWTDTEIRDILGYTADAVDWDTSTQGFYSGTVVNEASCAMVELRRDRAFFNTYTPPGGTGDSFSKSGNTVTLTDAGYTFRGDEIGKTVTIAGATTGGNNGTFEITAVNDHTVAYTNAAGAAEAFAGTWQLDSASDGFKVAYLSRGYRMGRNYTADPDLVTPARAAQGFIVILPYGTTEATAMAVAEALRVKKAGGFVAYVERRVNP